MDSAPIVAAVQKSLGLNRIELARLIGVDVRTMDRWRDCVDPPHGAGWKILNAIWRHLNSTSAPALRALASGALEEPNALDRFLDQLLSVAIATSTSVE